MSDEKLNQPSLLANLEEHLMQLSTIGITNRVLCKATYKTLIEGEPKNRELFLKNLAHEIQKAKDAYDIDHLYFDELDGLYQEVAAPH